MSEQFTVPVPPGRSIDASSTIAEDGQSLDQVLARDTARIAQQAERRASKGPHQQVIDQLRSDRTMSGTFEDPLAGRMPGHEVEIETRDQWTDILDQDNRRFEEQARTKPQEAPIDQSALRPFALTPLRAKVEDEDLKADDLVGPSVEVGNGRVSFDVRGWAEGSAIEAFQAQVAAEQAKLAEEFAAWQAEHKNEAAEASVRTLEEKHARLKADLDEAEAKLKIEKARLDHAVDHGVPTGACEQAVFAAVHKLDAIARVTLKVRDQLEAARAALVQEQQDARDQWADGKRAELEKAKQKAWRILLEQTARAAIQWRAADAALTYGLDRLVNPPNPE
jgi:hypothetical protein